MSDRTIAGLVMLLPTALCWWLAWGYVQAGEIYSAKVGRSVTRTQGPKRFWAAVVITALLGCYTFAMALLCFLL